MMPKNAVEHVCHVHILMNTINRDGDDIYFLAKKIGLCISGIRGTLSFNRKEVNKWNVEVLSENRSTIFHLCTSWFASGKASQNLQRKTLQVRKSGKKTSAKPYIVRLPYHSETELQSQLKLLAHFCSHRHQKDADFLSSIRAFI